MGRIGDPRAITALARSGGHLARKCFLRNSFSGPVGRGRGGVGVPRTPIGAAAPESEDKIKPISGGWGQGIQIDQQKIEVVDDGVVEWREAVQRRISLVDLQNRAGENRAAGRGRGVGAVSPQDSVGGRGIPSSVQPNVSQGFGRGRGIPVAPPQSAGRGRVIPPPGTIGATDRGIPLSPLGSLSESEKVQDDSFELSEQDSEVSDASAGIEAAAPTPPRIFFAPQISLRSMGRGRGQVDEGFPSTIGADSESEQQFGKDGRKVGKGQPTSSRAQRLQLSTEEARARAIAILEEGIEKNVAAEGERRRKGGMEKFADANEMFADRFKRAPGQVPSQTQGVRKERGRPKRTGRSRGPRSSGEFSVAEPSIDEQLTPEQEAELLRLDNESTFKENLHRLFLVQFEPEYAMEEFGKNPDIEEPAVLSLEEYLQSLKPMFLKESAELSQEQKWQEVVKASLANAPQLEQLVESYAGKGRMTARQQIQKMEAISEKLSKTVSPEVSAFTQRALITLQNNPGLTFQQKERLMKNLVTGFSSV